MERDVLKLENQLCFPLYAAARTVEKRYYKLLSEIDLTYTQYITMMVLWQEKEISVKALGERLFLDSGTLTPVLKSLEKKGFVKRERSKQDERVVMVSATKQGEILKEKAKDIPNKIAACFNLKQEEAVTLYKLLYKVLDK